MENETLTNHRLKSIESQLATQDNKLNTLDTDVKKLNQRTNDRYNEISNLSSRLEESYKNQSETVNRLLSSIDGLVKEMKQTNKTYNEQFKTVDTKLGTLENKITNMSLFKQSDSSKQIESDDKEKVGLSSVSKGAIVIGIIGVLETFIRYVAPLLVN
ncbi:hypothetical protein [Staphylococcus sp. LKG3-3]|uniref:hypothetical protein n=1 Tax=Staphylococcus sp. LKG3-3 TaxID=3399685 RepID=UPI003D5C43CD